MGAGVPYHLHRIDLLKPDRTPTIPVPIKYCPGPDVFRVFGGQRNLPDGVQTRPTFAPGRRDYPVRYALVRGTTLADSLHADHLISTAAQIVKASFAVSVHNVLMWIVLYVYNVRALEVTELLSSPRIFGLALRPEHACGLERVEYVLPEYCLA